MKQDRILLRGGGRRHHLRRAIATATLIGSAVALPLAGANAATSKPKAASTFNLSQLVAQAQTEGSLNVWDSSSSVLQIAQNFQAAYGIKVNAQKISATTMVTKLEALAGSTSPSTDVVLFATGPQLAAQLDAQGIVKSWVPPDLHIPANFQSPLVYLYQPAVFYYNKSVYGNNCPISNIWQLTQPKFRGLFATVDPTQTPELLEWFSEMTINGRNQLASAYKQLTGKTLKTKNAGYTFIQDLAANQPLIEASLDNVVQAVGAPGVAHPAIGLAHGTTYADAVALGYSVAMCRGITPFDGYQYPKFVVETTNTPHPAAAELFIHYVETAGGSAPAIAGGAQSANRTVPRGADGPPGLLDTEAKPSNFEYLALWSLKKDFQQQAAISQLWSESLAG